MPAKPFAFLSYAHRDDDGGAVSKLCLELSGAFSKAIGEHFPIFMDIEDIEWGDNWRTKIDQGLLDSSVMIAILSPSYFKSDECRKELRDFLEIERKAGEQDLILPIYFFETEFLEKPLPCDGGKLATILKKRNIRDWKELRNRLFDDIGKARDELESWAVKIVRARGWENAAASGGRKKSEPIRGENDDDHGDLSEPVRNFTISPCVFRDIDQSWCPELVEIPPGSFIMGSPQDEEGHQANEEPNHDVNIETPFALCIYLVTFSQFDKFCDDTGHEKPDSSGWERGGRPVINVNVEDAIAYLAWLTALTGKNYFLPSEAMWEYACRAGTTTPFSTGKNITTNQANFNGNHPYVSGRNGEFRNQTTKVGIFPANSFGLFDMHGNVWEWCADSRHDTYEGAPTDEAAWLGREASKQHALRGGSWYSPAHQLRSARRMWAHGNDSFNMVGFRCARLKR